MRHPALIRAALTALAAVTLCGAATAQISTGPRSDSAPPPAEDRNSLGAVVLMDEPVLAQREAMRNALAAGPDTRSMGAGPASLLRRTLNKDELQRFKSEAAELRRNGVMHRTPK